MKWVLFLLSLIFLFAANNALFWAPGRYDWLNFTAAGNGKPCSMVRINSTRSASCAALRRHPSFPVKSGSTSRSHEVQLAKTGMLWVKRAGDRRSCSFLARNFLGKTWYGHQKQKLTKYRKHLSKSR